LGSNPSRCYGSLSSPKRPYRHWVPHSYALGGYRDSFVGQSGLDVNLTTHLHLVPKLGLKMSGAVPLLHLTPSWRGQGQYYLHVFLLFNEHWGFFSQKKSGRGLALTIDFPPVSRLRMNGIEPPHPYTFTECTSKTVPLR
jgi:hypothetical protein